MPDHTITVSTNENKILNKLATAAGKTIPQYLEALISNYCTGQIRGFFVDKIKNKTTDELITLLGDIT